MRFCDDTSSSCVERVPKERISCNFEPDRSKHVLPLDACRSVALRKARPLSTRAEGRPQAPMGRRQADPGGEAAECRPSVGRACPSVGLPPKAPRAECDPALDTNSSAKRRPMNCWCHPYDACHSKGGYDEYASRLDEAYYK